jgi:hypothetical protein
MADACSEASAMIQLVQIQVLFIHLLLLLKQALPWEAIHRSDDAALTPEWQKCRGGRVYPGDVSLYVPLVARVFMGTPPQG